MKVQIKKNQGGLHNFQRCNPVSFLSSAEERQQNSNNFLVTAEVGTDQEPDTGPCQGQDHMWKQWVDKIGLN